MPPLIAKPAVSVAFDVALWFLEQARSADGHLPAQKLQNLLYLACVHYEREHDGAPLMPAAFVVNDIAVVEPNLYRLLEDGRPRMRGEAPSAPIQVFLADIWSRYAHYQVEHLNRLVHRLLKNRQGEEFPSASAAKTPEENHGVTDDGVSTIAVESRSTHLGRRVIVAPWRPPIVAKKSS